MSLQVWLPLTKDLHNQGLANVSITNNGATYSSTGGKLGGCYILDGVDDRIQISNLSQPQNISVAMWFKRGANTNTRQFLFTAWNGITLELSTSGTITCSVSTTDGQVGYCTTNTAITTSTGWTHICYTFENGVGTKLYVNGEFQMATAVAKPINWNTTTGNIGYFSTYLNASINDFRIYDNVLSEKEIKEISKGLILHYPLNRRGLGNENLLANTNTEKTGSSATAQWFRWNVVNPMLDTGTTYTLSFDAKMTVTTDVFYISWSNADSTQEIINQGTQVTTEYKRYSFTGQTTKTNINAILISNYKGYNRGNNNNTTGVLSVRNIKLELGDKATPYCLNSSDTIYSQMNLNSSTIYDYSGFNNNGEITGTLGVNSDSPKYNCSTSFPSGANFIRAGRGAMVNDSITVNLWAKWSTWGNPISCTEGGGWNFENGSSSIRFPVYVSGVGYKLAESGVAPGTLANQWHMLTGTFDKTNVKIYIDGVLKGTTATGSTNGIGYPSNNVIFVAAESAGNNTTPESNAFVGNISDVRIYATALSATDILSLYNNNAYIDQSGQIYGPVHEV